MKHIAFVVLVLTIAPTSRAQILFQSGLENWSAGVPNGMIGARTDLPQDLISEETTLVHGGAKAMRLSLGQLSEKKLSTSPLSVEAGQLYDIRFWVLGKGRIRTGVYDGRPEAEGYAPYNSVVVANSNLEWQQVLQTVYVTNATSNAEFIFAVEGTSSIDYLVIDDILISTSSLPNPIVATIAEIQTTTSPFEYSPLNFQFVRTSGIVTGVTSSTYFIQDGSGPWNGIQVFYPPPTLLSIGDSVTVMATVTEFQGLQEPWFRTLTQLIVVQQLIIHSSGHTPPAPITVTAIEAGAEQWEGVLVRIQDLECETLPEPDANEWSAVNWQGGTIIDDLLYLHNPTVGNFYTITGIAHYEGVRKLLPRSSADFEAGVGIAESGVSVLRIYPNPAADVITIEYDGSLKSAPFTLLNGAGQFVVAGRLDGNRDQVDLRSLEDGVYILVLDGPTPHRTAPIIVHR